MEFDNQAAFLYDSYLYGGSDSPFYNILSFLGNSAYVKALACEVLNDLDISSVIPNNISDWLKTEEHLIRLTKLLKRIMDERNQLGIVSCFVDKTFGEFLFLFGILMPKIRTEDLESIAFETLYSNYLHKVASRHEKLKIEEKIDIFHKFLKYSLEQGNAFRNLKYAYQENSEMLTKLTNIISTTSEDDLFTGFLDHFYCHELNLVHTYEMKGVKKIYASKRTADNLRDDIRITSKNYNPSFYLIDGDKKEKDETASLAYLLMLLADYAIKKVHFIENVSSLTDDDKFLFVSIWALLQGEKSEWILNKDMYNKIKEIFVSVKHDFNI